MLSTVPKELTWKKQWCFWLLAVSSPQWTALTSSHCRYQLPKQLPELWCLFWTLPIWGKKKALFSAQMLLANLSSLFLLARDKLISALWKCENKLLYNTYPVSCWNQLVFPFGARFRFLWTNSSSKGRDLMHLIKQHQSSILKPHTNLLKLLQLNYKTAYLPKSPETEILIQSSDVFLVSHCKIIFGNGGKNNKCTNAAKCSWVKCWVAHITAVFHRSILLCIPSFPFIPRLSSQVHLGLIPRKELRTEKI